MTSAEQTRNLRCMADERMTEVRVERYRDDGDRRGATSVTVVRQVPASVSVGETIDMAMEQLYDHVALPRGSHPDVADSGQPGEATWLRDGEREEFRRAIKAAVASEAALDEMGRRPIVADSAAREDAEMDPAQVIAELRRFGGGAPYERQHGETRTRSLAEREDGMDFADKAAIARHAAQRLHMETACTCLGKPYGCAPHGAIGTGCEDHGYASDYDPATVVMAAAPPTWTPIRTEFTETREGKIVPVEVDDLAQDRAEQLIAALAVALRGQLSDLARDEPFLDFDDLARKALSHPYVRDALEPARAVVWAEPLGTIVSFSYPDSETPVKANHVRVRLDPGVVVSADTIGKKVAVAK